MITDDSLRKGLDSDYSHKVIATDVKRVIIPLKEGIKVSDVQYIEWDGSSAKGNGFLFTNGTDKREQFIRSEEGIFIGHEGECPEGDGGEMITRSEAVSKYLAQHLDALSSKENIEKTIKYFQEKVFRHVVDEPTKWDGKAVPDIWTSDKGWLRKNFNEADILNPDGTFKQVISAAKKTDGMESKAMYIGPNAEVSGIGITGNRGSYVIEKPDGKRDLCTEEVYNKTYKYSGQRGDAQMIRTEKGYDVMYPKGSMRYMPDLTDPRDSFNASFDINNKASKYKSRIAELETPVYRVIGNAICDYMERNPKNTIRMELEINSLIATDKNPLSIDEKNPKSERLRQLLTDKIIDSKGKIINPQGFADSEFLKNYKGYGVDLTQTTTIQKLADKSFDINSNANSGRKL